MAWGKVDDKLWGSPKWISTPPRARGLWVTALSWSMDQLTDGNVPTHALPILGATRADARALVNAGLWETTTDGWRFHDWLDYQPDSASVRAARDAKSTGGKQGNHERWHAQRGVRVDGCEFCYPVHRITDRRTHRISDR